MLASYLKIFKKSASEFKAFSLNKVYSKDNVEADALTNLGFSLMIPPETRIPIIHVMIPTIEYPTKRTEVPDDQMATLQQLGILLLNTLIRILTFRILIQIIGSYEV